MSHSTCTHWGRVNCRLLVIGSQIGNLTPGLSFVHNLCCKYLNGTCKVIFDIYTSIPFQRYKEHIKARCFDPCNRTLSFWESRRIPKSSLRECECHPHTPSKWGCDTTIPLNQGQNFINCPNFISNFELIITFIALTTEFILTPHPFGVSNIPFWFAIIFCMVIMFWFLR